MSISEYIPTIGLEVHAELKTQTKMFCNSANDPDEIEPNVNVCPVCMGHPGTLPVINKEAVRHVLKVGVAVGGKLADFTEFDRKNYFYPDIPKGYQITQYKYPLVSGGSINRVELTRIHLEEDTALNKHVGTSVNGSGDSESSRSGGYSLVDYNRAGIPLMELVTEPFIHSAEEAKTFSKELQLLLRHLDVSEANMEKGEMRVEANISVSKNKNKLGTKVEIKNLNSFKAVERGILYEIDRQTKLLENGKNIVQETRGWDEDKQETFSQRAKETSEDYRYFPEPDLPKLKISEIPEFSSDVLKEELPELPWERRKRYLDLGLKAEDADMFVITLPIGRFFDAVVEKLKSKEDISLAANYIAADLAGLASGSALEIDPEKFSDLIAMASSGDVSSRGAKDILKIMFERGGDPSDIAKKEELLQKSDERELKKIVENIIFNNKNVVKEYQSGKEASLKFLIGQAMKATGGSANPGVLQKLFKELLK